MTVPTRTFLISLTSFYLLIVGVEDYCCALSHSVTSTHTQTHTHIHTHSVGLLWMSDQPVAGTSTRLDTNFTRQRSRPPAGFEPAIRASEEPQTHALDRVATGIDPVRVVALYSEGEASAGFMAHVITSRPFYISSYRFVCHIFALRTVCLFSKLLSHTTEGRLVTIHQHHRRSGDIRSIAASYLTGP
jgi:hypothetical protein